MKLFKELNISLENQELISITGGGGKTTSMFRLARELLKYDKKVLLTTTTAIMKPDESKYERMYLTQDTDYKTIQASSSGITVLGSKINKMNKLIGVEQQIIDEIFKSKKFDYIIVEADGSKRKPIKAPASHEPVIPALTTKTIGIIGMDAVGQKIYEENVHRARLFSQVTNSKLGDRIDETTIYNLIVSPEGIFKNSPSESQNYIILNKSETKNRNLVSQKVKSKLVSNKINIKKIIIGSIGKEVKVTGIIMASGFSRRMKTDKLLLKLGDKMVLEKVIESCVKSSLDDIIVIYRKEEVKNIATEYNLKAVLNENAIEGQSASIKLGVNNIDKDTKGIMFIVGDQPHLDPLTIDAIIDKFENNQEKIIIPIYDGNKGNPTIFPVSLKEQLNALKGDVGGKEVINSNLEQVDYVEIENHQAGVDMDTVEEYEKLKEDFE